MSVGIEEEVRGQLEDDSIKHEAALLLLRRYLRRRCEELESGDFRYRLIEDRVKCAKSCADNLARKEKEAGDLYDAVEDLIGARVVVYNLSDRSLLAEAISNDDACPLSHLKLDEIDREDGYRAIHINGQFAYDERLSGEIQILTALQDGWAITSRAYLYRRDQQDERSLKIARAKSFGIHAVDLMLEDIRQRAGEVGVEAGAEGEPTQVAEIPPTEEDVEAKDTEPLAVDAAAIQIAFDQFDREDRDIAGSPISAQRINALRQGLADLTDRSPVAQIWGRGNAFLSKPEQNEESTYGMFRVLLEKGPFVDGSNWHSYRPDEIVRMFDDHEIEGLSKLLRGDGIRYLNPVGSDRVEDFVLKASSDVEARGGAADLVVVVLDRNPPAIRWLIQSLNYRIMPEIRGAAINAEGVQTGTFAGKPVLEVFAELGGKPPSVHVLDLERFASYTRYFPVDGEDYLHLHVEDINQERAIGIVEEHPDLLSVLGGRQLTPEEGIAELMTRVVFSISAAGRWEIRDGHQGAVSAYLEFEDPA